MADAQPLSNRLPIVNEDGTPTEFFMRWARQFNESAAGQGSIDALQDELDNLSFSAEVISDADDYTLAPADVDKYIRLTGASAKTINIEPEATTALPANGEWHFRNAGEGDATVMPGIGVAVNAPNGGSLVVPDGGTVTIKRVAEDVFDLFGVTVAE